MRTINRTLFGALVAILAVGVLAAGSASAALPEFKGENFALEHVAFTGTGGTVSIETINGSAYECKTSSIAGEIINSTEVGHVVVTFSGGGSCTNFCQTSTGVWVTNQLKGRIAYVSKSLRTVGLLLEPVTEPMTTCSHFGIGGAKVQKSIIGQLTGLNVLRKTPFGLSYTGTSGVQSIQHFDGEEVIHNLQILPLEAPSATKFAIRTEMTLTAARQIEIAA